MGRARIIMLLYVMTFLMSAYIKFTNPHIFSLNENVITLHKPQNLELYLNKVGKEAQLQFQWRKTQKRCEFELQISRIDEDENEVPLTFSQDGKQTQKLKIEQHYLGKLKSKTIKGHNKYCYDLLKIDPVTGECQLLKEATPSGWLVENNNELTFESGQNPGFSVEFNLPSGKMAYTGNYKIYLIEKIKGKLKYNPQVIKIFDEPPPPDLIISYPPADYNIDDRYPVGLPLRQTVIANHAIERFDMTVGSIVYEDIIVPQDVEFFNDQDLSITVFENREVLEIKFPNIEEATGNIKHVEFTAYSGPQVATVGWDIPVIPLQFATWPPIAPKKWSPPEERIFNQFKNRFSVENGYARSSGTPTLLYETRPFKINYQLQNIAYNRYQSMTLRYSTGQSYNFRFRDGKCVGQDGTPLGDMNLTVPKNCTYGTLTVRTVDSQDHSFSFNVKQVPADFPIKDMSIFTQSGNLIYVNAFYYDDFGDLLNSEDVRCLNNTSVMRSRRDNSENGWLLNCSALNRQTDLDVSVVLETKYYDEPKSLTFNTTYKP